MIALGLYLTVLVNLLSTTSGNLQRSTTTTTEKTPTADSTKIGRLYFGTLVYVNATKDQELINGVFDAILNRLAKLNVEDVHEKNVGRYDMTTLLCWAVNNYLLYDKYNEKADMVYKLAKKFYPERNDKAKTEREILARQPCKANLPVTVITGFAWNKT
uniref:Salivary secreted peptide n=1 Tax=Aedes aegypti TaxID=7159 RepID=Q1HRS2_AEDAE|nr:salivary secreted peptide [Aedes aegypti]